MAALAALAASPATAQQDPDDPGIQDSLIIAPVMPDHVDSSSQFQYKNIQLMAVTDDSVCFYNFPLKWHAPQGGIYFGSGTNYYPPLYGCWDYIYDTIWTDQNYISQFYFCHLDTLLECAPIYTNGVRYVFKSLRLVISPNTPSQLVVLDTCWDDRNGSALFGLMDGETEITPAIQRGFCSIGAVGIDDGINQIPEKFILSQNYPNPFNSSTTIEYAIPYGGRVTLEVFDILGRRVSVIIDEIYNPGEYAVIWHGMDNGNAVPSGIYFYRLTAQSFAETKRMILLK